MPIAGQLNESQQADNEGAAQQLGNAGRQAISANQFVYFAAFDGTNNDKDNLSLTGGAFSAPDAQQTNAAQLFEQVDAARASNNNVAADYFRGVGTDGPLDLSAAFADARVEANAQAAYARFSAAARDWIVENPGGSVTVALAAFSRGGPTAIRFAQLLNERGLAGADGTSLIRPGQLLVSAMALIDPVGTMVADERSMIPSNVVRDNFVVIDARNEYRGAYRREHYNAGESVFSFYGNHCDVGGCVGGGGAGELVLGGTNGSGGLTRFFRNAGLTIADAPETRRYCATAPQYVHDNSRDNNGNLLWSVHGAFNPVGPSSERLVDEIAVSPLSTGGDHQPVYEMSSPRDVLSAEAAMRCLVNDGTVNRDWYENIFTPRVTDFWLTQPSTAPQPTLPPYNPGMGPGYDPWSGLNTDPIGAFYESAAPGADAAASVADRTPVLLDGEQRPVSAGDLRARDADGDGRLSGAELDGLSAWADTNENGLIDWGERHRLGAGNAGGGTPGEIAESGTEHALGIEPLDEARGDYAFYTQGNGIAAEAVAAPPLVDPTAPELSAPASNYRALRDTDNAYAWEYGQQYGVIEWRTDQVKINKNNPTHLIGTDANDNFDARYYAAYANYFNLGLLSHFLAGGGDDVMGGSDRSDHLWGGSGNDTLFGYAGDDALYGEEGDDRLLGAEGDDRLAGGAGNDCMFGEVGTQHRPLHFARSCRASGARWRCDGRWHRQRARQFALRKRRCQPAEWPCR